MPGFKWPPLTSYHNYLLLPTKTKTTNKAKGTFSGFVVVAIINVKIIVPKNSQNNF